MKRELLRKPLIQRSNVTGRPLSLVAIALMLILGKMETAQSAVFYSSQVSNSPLAGSSDSSSPDQYTIATDLDHDEQPDQAGLRFSENGYEVSVILHAHPESNSRLFWPGSRRAAVGLVSCDVDEDGDQDLVLTSATSLFPLAIWIGDGAGHFVQANQGSFVPLFSGSHRPNFHPGKTINKQVCLPRQRRIAGGLIQDALHPVDLRINSLLTGSVRGAFSSKAFELPLSRSPPSA
ncbi:MAG: VCBS repeat-containing protein [Terriglobia bacterium]